MKQNEKKKKSRCNRQVNRVKKYAKCRPRFIVLYLNGCIEMTETRSKNHQLNSLFNYDVHLFLCYVFFLR